VGDHRSGGSPDNERPVIHQVGDHGTGSGVPPPRDAAVADPGAVRIEWLLRRQDGVITMAQARAAGLSDRAVRHRVTAGTWIRLHPRVYFVADRALTDRARVRAAGLWAAPRAAVTGVAAAWWQGLLPGCPAEVEVTVGRGRQPGARPGVLVRRRDLDTRDLVKIDGLWLTDVPLTVLETAVDLGADGPALLDRALQRWASFEALHRAHCRNLGRRGSPDAGRLLAAAADRAASGAERRLVTLLREAGIGGWVLGHRLGGYVLDMAFPEARVAIEVDGWAWHSGADRFRADRRRQNAVVLAGWSVLRFTWDDLVHRPHRVVAEVTAALAAAHRPA
jgi:very-short-patch-repair endonuclease